MVTDEMVSAAVWAHQNAPTRIGHPFIPMRAAITAALEASGELERLRAALKEIDALDPEWQSIESWHPDEVKGLVLSMGRIARTALEGSTI